MRGLVFASLFLFLNPNGHAEGEIANVRALSQCAAQLTQFRAQALAWFPKSLLLTDATLARLVEEVSELEGAIGTLEDLLDEEENLAWQSHLVNNALSYCAKTNTILHDRFIAFRNLFYGLILCGLVLTVNLSIGRSPVVEKRHAHNERTQHRDRPSSTHMG